jgi:hypothetical protein
LYHLVNRAVELAEKLTAKFLRRLEDDERTAVGLQILIPAVNGNEAVRHGGTPLRLKRLKEQKRPKLLSFLRMLPF